MTVRPREEASAAEASAGPPGAVTMHPPALDIEQLFRDHASYIGRCARYMGVRESDLQDVLQEVFLVAYRRRDAFERRSSVKTWLYGICIRVVSDHRRRAFRRREVLSDALDEGATDGRGPERAVERREARAALQRGLEALDDEKRQVFVLFEVEQLSMKDVAAAVGCPLKTAYSRLYAARKQILETLTPERGERP